MLTAVKGNREVKISEDQKAEYLKAGYDVIDEKGNRTAAPSKTMPYSEYAKVLEEIKQAKISMTELTAAYDDACKKVSDLIKDNEKLKKELEKAKKGD